MELEIHLLEKELISKVGGAGDKFLLEIQLILKVDGAGDTFLLEIQLILKVGGAGDTFVRETTDCKRWWSWIYMQKRYN